MSEITRNITQQARILGLEFTDTALELIESLIIAAEDAGIERGNEAGYEAGYGAGFSEGCDAGEQYQQDLQEEAINGLENELENAKLEISALEALVDELQS